MRVILTILLLSANIAIADDELIPPTEAEYKSIQT